MLFMNLLRIYNLEEWSLNRDFVKDYDETAHSITSHIYIDPNKETKLKNYIYRFIDYLTQQAESITIEPLL